MGGKVFQKCYTDIIPTILSDNVVQLKMPQMDETLDRVNQNKNSIQYTKSEYDTEIKELLDKYVKPAVENDGGAIEFLGFNEGTVTVLLKGACAGCPSSTATLKGGVENLLKQHVSAVKEVVAENE